MIIIFAIISLYFFIRAVSFGIYEIKTNNNTFAGIVTFIIALIRAYFSKCCNLGKWYLLD